MWVGRGWESPSKLFISDLLKVTLILVQAVMQMITTSSKFSELFLLKGKLYCINCLFVYFFQFMLRFQWKPKNLIEIHVAWQRKVKVI